ncbi:MAG TPA: secretin N-terminal domain-containing protein [Thermoanaerobaculia bacterium]|nr:secretin N-terminal domain-containing protein [Thermoanaerobaculia bacterium]
MRRPLLLLPLLLLMLPFLGGCSFTEYRRAQLAEQREDWDQAVIFYLQLVQKQPDDLTYRAALMRSKIKASQSHFETGKRFADAGSLERAQFEYRQAVELDSSNQYAATELEKVRQALARQQHAQGELRTIEEMKKEAQERSKPPLLEPRSKTPISLEFPNPVSIKDIYRALGKAFGINILFDPNLKDQEIAIELKDVTAQDALEILMRAAQHFYKVLDAHTILIAADTPQNRRAYEDLVIQTFFLSNSDVKDVMTMLRTLVDAKKLAANERLNAIILRDSIDRVKVAERLIETNDKARAEVVVDVELLQINSRKARTLGTALSSYSISQGFMPGLDVDTTTPGTQLGVDDLAFLNRSSWALTIPTFIYSFVKANTDAQVLARPQLRISEGEKAALIIGDKIPIPTTTFNTSNTVGGSIVPITSFQYQDVGIKINIEPRVHHNLEVTLKLHVEVSQLNGTVTLSGQEQPIIGTRQVDTVIRLKDGETNFLAGLLRSDETSGTEGIPGLSEIPIIGRLFSREIRDAQRTDVVLTMTPHIIRRSDIVEADLEPIWVGTEQNITFRNSPRVESEVEGGPFDEGTAAADRVRELIRQRVQELPPGLEEGGYDAAGQEVAPEKEQQPPQGIDLVPPTFPDQQPPPAEIEEPEPDEEPPNAALENAGEADEVAAAGEIAADAGEIATEETAIAATAGDATSAPSGAVLAAARVRTPAKVRLRLVPGALGVTAGDRFELRIDADARAPLSHLPLVVTYNAQVLEPVSWVRGPLLGAEGEAELLGAVGPPGRLLLGASRLGDRPGVTGTGTVAVITFVAKRAGAATVRLDHPKALGPALDALQPVTATNAKVQVAPAEPGADARTSAIEEGPHA